MSAALTTPAQPGDLVAGPSLTYPKLDALPADLLALVDELPLELNEEQRWSVLHRAVSKAKREGVSVSSGHVEDAGYELTQGWL